MQIDWAVVFATLAGPILAVWASEWRQQRRALHERKEWVFPHADEHPCSKASY